MPYLRSTSYKHHPWPLLSVTKPGPVEVDDRVVLQRSESCGGARVFCTGASMSVDRDEECSGWQVMVVSGGRELRDSTRARPWQAAKGIGKVCSRSRGGKERDRQPARTFWLSDSRVDSTFSLLF